MYFVVLLVIVAAVVAQPRGEGMPKCGRIAHGGLTCCKKELPTKPPLSDDVKECFQLAKKPPSCDLEICIAKKHGFSSDDGTFDKKKMAENVGNMFESDPDLADKIKETCVNGDLSKYGPEDICDLMKFKLCTEVQVVKSCDEWSNEGDCSGMKELAAECVKEFE